MIFWILAVSQLVARLAWLRTSFSILAFMYSMAPRPAPMVVSRSSICSLSLKYTTHCCFRSVRPGVKFRVASRFFSSIPRTVPGQRNSRWYCRLGSMTVPQLKNTPRKKELMQQCFPSFWVQNHSAEICRNRVWKSFRSSGFCSSSR